MHLNNLRLYICFIVIHIHLFPPIIFNAFSTEFWFSYIWRDSSVIGWNSKDNLEFVDEKRYWMTRPSFVLSVYSWNLWVKRSLTAEIERKEDNKVYGSSQNMGEYFSLNIANELFCIVGAHYCSHGYFRDVMAKLSHKWGAVKEESNFGQMKCRYVGSKV